MALGGRVIGTVLLLGAGAVAIAAVAAGPRLLAAARPLAREGLKRGLTLYRQARASAAELAEDVEDLVAEVKADLTAKPGEAPAREQSVTEDSNVAR